MYLTSGIRAHVRYIYGFERSSIICDCFVSSCVNPEKWLWLCIPDPGIVMREQCMRFYQV